MEQIELIEPIEPIELITPIKPIEPIEPIIRPIFIARRRTNVLSYLSFHLVEFLVAFLISLFFNKNSVCKVLSIEELVVRASVARGQGSGLSA